MTAATPSRRTRLVLTAASVVAGSTLLAGCQIISPRQTEQMYDAGDGVSTNVGQIEVRNLLVVSEREGGPGVVSGAIGNPTAQATEVTIAGTDGGTGTAVSIPAYSTVNLSTGGSKVTIASVPDRPGAMTSLTVSSAAAGTSPVSVPVLEPVGYYADFKP